MVALLICYRKIIWQDARGLRAALYGHRKTAEVWIEGFMDWSLKIAVERQRYIGSVQPGGFCLYILWLKAELVEKRMFVFAFKLQTIWVWGVKMERNPCQHYFCLFYNVANESSSNWQEDPLPLTSLRVHNANSRGSYLLSYIYQASALPRAACLLVFCLCNWWQSYFYYWHHLYISIKNINYIIITFWFWKTLSASHILP